MHFARCTRGSRKTEGFTGYTLPELLVAMLLTGVVLAMAARDFGFTVGMRHDLDILVETQHALQAALTEITQELRQAGACLPTTGDFISLDGQDDGTRDRLTLRTGRVEPENVVCVKTGLTEIAQQGASILPVADSTRFAAGQLIYVAHSTGTGNTFVVAGVQPERIFIEGGLEMDYKASDGVYAFEERIYQVDESSGHPILTVAIDGGDPQPLVDGIERFDVRYSLAPCPPCDPVDEPRDDEEWYRVREVVVDVGVVSKQPRRDGKPVRLSGSTNIRPRNLL